MSLDPDNSATLLQLTDTHLFAAADASMRGVRTADSLAAVVRAARANAAYDPDSLVVTGDIAQDGSREAYQRLAAALSGFTRPVFCLPGNHDDPDQMMQCLNEPPFSTTKSFTLGSWAVLMLNSFQPGSAAGRLAPEELQVLANSIAEYAEYHLLICLHHQVLPVGSRWLDSVGLENAAELLDLIESSANVRAVVHGHVHQVSERRQNGISHFSSPSTCRQFLPDSDDFALDTDAAPGCRWLRLHPDGTVTSEVQWLDTP